MGKNNDKRMCWNCDASVSVHFASCPYCGVDLTADPPPQDQKPYQRNDLASPFQNAFSENPKPQAAPKNEDVAQETDSVKQELFSLLLLLPGAVLLLFALFILIFSKDGSLTLEWTRSSSYFYFVTSIPLLYLGWKASR